MGEIPGIDSIERLAQFWGVRDLTDFEDELEEVEEPVFDSGIRPETDAPRNHST
jgi:hypothetical protein